MSTTEDFDSLCREIDRKFEAHIGPWNETAKDYVPRLWASLESEPDKAQRRKQTENASAIHGRWAIKTIRDALPDEAKNELRIHGQKSKKPEIEVINNSSVSSVTDESEAILASDNFEASKPHRNFTKYTVAPDGESFVIDENVGLQQKVAELENTIAELTQGLESKPLTTAKQQLDKRYVVTLEPGIFSAIFLAVQRAAMHKRNVLLTIDNHKVVEAHADE